MRRYRVTRLVALPAMLVGLQSCGREVSAPIGEAPGFAQSGPTSLTVTATAPGAAAPGTTLDVHIYGSGFEHGAAVAFVRSGGRAGHISTNATQFVSSTELIANVTVAEGADADLYSVEVSYAVRGPRKKGVGADLFSVTLEASTTGEEVRSSVSGQGRYAALQKQWTSSFNAKTARDGTVNGNFSHGNASSDMRGSVTCVAIVGTKAWLGGVIDGATEPSLEGQAIGWVAVDNGEGANAPPDQMGAPLLLGAVAPTDFCAATPSVEASNLISGNVQLRR